jgi:hypothetical protein
VTDPHMLNRKAVLEVYAAIINRSITDEVHQALVHEIFEHADAQGRLIARLGNLAYKHAPRPFDAGTVAIFDEVKKAME